MPGTNTDTVDLVWDLTRERRTLGGALVLRQEGEMLARISGASSLRLHCLGAAADDADTDRLAKSVFATSAYPVQFNHASCPIDGWPNSILRALPEFSYFSFSRLQALHAQKAPIPRLSWNTRTNDSARYARARFPGRLVCIHLRNVPPYVAEESNADGPTWDEFFTTHAQPGLLDFLLLGNDLLPVGLALRPGLYRAADLDWDLATQLALIGCADGFLGMASGLCTAANLSDTPHVIFKHPAHHLAEMSRELGSSDRFPFAGPRQRLWRRTVTPEALREALAIISP